ncbi:hypothetical protein BZM27_50625 [Paraburkholderia steynii]|uniref:Uncharacterized protein n=1 Tax=Paraburkholderia steynii TaxID=1245441 RepID=A0A4V2NG09_9BURK|nr:hypothetical protein BZM27_50625 [Paraburkholderia steynii]
MSQPVWLDQCLPVDLIPNILQTQIGDGGLSFEFVSARRVVLQPDVLVAIDRALQVTRTRRHLEVVDAHAWTDIVNA